MGTHASLYLRSSVEHLEQIVAILLMASAQALEIWGVDKASMGARRVISAYRMIVPFLRVDRPAHDDLTRSIDFLRAEHLQLRTEQMKGVQTMEKRSKEPTGIIGKHLIYTYENGWQYEIYVKNSHTFCYRIHSGKVGGRWVTDQEADIVEIGDQVFKISWDEPTGTIVCVTVNLKRWKLHGVIFFPRWVADDPEKTICYQNEYLDLMRTYRDAGPTYPKWIVSETAQITFWEECGSDRNDVIDCPPSELPSGYTSRTNVRLH